MDLLHIAVGILGLLVIVLSMTIIISRRCYSLFSNTFFVEPASELGKRAVQERMEKERWAQRYILTAVLIVLGLVAIAWALGWEII